MSEPASLGLFGFVLSLVAARYGALRDDNTDNMESEPATLTTDDARRSGTVTRE